jgi:Glycosyl transferase family 2
MPAITRSNPEPIVDIVVPVYNEEHDLERSVRRLRTYLDERFPFAARITGADNVSTDATWRIAQRLEAELPGVQAIHLEQKGRGRALRTAWSASDATVVAYMDVDLSTGLEALLPLVAGLLSGRYEIAIGSRLARGAHVVRGPKREIISRRYNLILRSLLSTRFHDAQCGFKALRADVARELLPLVEDQAWFFDTEMLVLAERAAMTSAVPTGSLELVTGDPLMAMGGFSGTDPAPSLAQIQADVASGPLRFVLVDGNGGGGTGGAGTSTTAAALTTWVISGWEGRRLRRQLGDLIRPLRRRYDWVLGGQCQ